VNWMHWITVALFVLAALAGGDKASQDHKSAGFEQRQLLRDLRGDRLPRPGRTQDDRDREEADRRRRAAAAKPLDRHTAWVRDAIERGWKFPDG
jgi:hypothetical protein